MFTKKVWEKILFNVPRFQVRAKKKIIKTIKPYILKTKPVLEDEFRCTPALPVPAHIPRPDYVNSKNPLYGIYEGIPRIHDKETLKSINSSFGIKNIDKYIELRVAGNLAGRTAENILSKIKAGMTTNDVDKIVHDFIISHKAYPTAIGFMGFPKSVCTSVNEVVCHGIPNDRPLENGDFINLDITLFKDGVHGDTSVMAMIGTVDEEVQHLINVTQKCLYECIKLCKPGNNVNAIGKLCQEIAESYGYTVCDLFSGHGIGEILHMPPMVQHIANSCPDIMIPGMAFTIEPIILMNKPQNYHLWKDNFTLIPIPRTPSAQWEHTMIITETGHEVITKRPNENFE